MHANVLKYLLRLKVLVEPEHEATAASGISRTSQVLIGESWVRELRHLARWVVVGCAAAFSSTEFGNPATGMMPVRRGLQKLLRPAPLWSYDTQTDLGVGAALALDYGDIIHRPIVDRALDVHDRLRFATRQIQALVDRPLLIGGERSLTYPVITELAQSVSGLRIVHFDAHADRRPLDTDSTTPDPGLLHSWHDDRDAEWAGVFTFYLDSWSSEWGGELDIIDCDSNELPSCGTHEESVVHAPLNATTVFPPSNRVVVMRSGALHRVRRVDQLAGSNVRRTISGSVWIAERTGAPRHLARDSAQRDDIVV